MKVWEFIEKIKDRPDDELVVEISETASRIDAENCLERVAAAERGATWESLRRWITRLPVEHIRRDTAKGKFKTIIDV